MFFVLHVPPCKILNFWPFYLFVITLDFEKKDIKYNFHGHMDSHMDDSVPWFCQILDLVQCPIYVKCPLCYVFFGT